MIGRARWTATAYADAARAPRTRREYAGCWKAWEVWCHARELAPMPATPEHVASYICDRADAGDRVSTIRVRMAALASVHREHGHDTPTTDHNILRIVRGIVRVQAGETPAQVAGLTAECMERIEEATDNRRRIQVENLALCWVMRDALMRESEAAALRWEDIGREKDGTGHLLIRRSKTDQTGAGHVAYLGRPAMQALARIEPDDPTGPVFGLHPQTIGRRIRATAKRAGIRGRFCGHSPRVGMSLDLAENGASLVEIQQVGRWKSPAMPGRYVRNQEAARGAVAKFYKRRTA